MTIKILYRYSLQKLHKKFGLRSDKKFCLGGSFINHVDKAGGKGLHLVKGSTKEEERGQKVQWIFYLLDSESF